MSNNIRESLKHFQMDDDSEALAAIDHMMGEGGQPSNKLDEYNGSMPLSDAMTAIQFRESPFYGSIIEGLKTISVDLQKQSENAHLTREERLSAVDQLLGVKKCLGFIGGLFIEAEGRVTNMSSDEKVLVGPEGRKQTIGKSPAQVVSTKTTEKKPVVTDQTQSAVAYLSKKVSN